MSQTRSTGSAQNTKTVFRLIRNICPKASYRQELEKRTRRMREITYLRYGRALMLLSYHASVSRVMISASNPNSPAANHPPRCWPRRGRGAPTRCRPREASAKIAGPQRRSACSPRRRHIERNEVRQEVAHKPKARESRAIRTAGGG